MKDTITISRTYYQVLTREFDKMVEELNKPRVQVSEPQAKLLTRDDVYKKVRDYFRKQPYRHEFSMYFTNDSSMILAEDACDALFGEGDDK